ncbi:MAG: hypothetical protein ACK5ZJ_13645, partial [Acidobacteriota bacterium]
MRATLRANIAETLPVSLIREQGGGANRNEQAVQEWSSLGGGGGGGRGGGPGRARRAGPPPPPTPPPPDPQPPSPEVRSRAQRRRFTAAYKQKILAAADAATAPGAIGALLRRE